MEIKKSGSSALNVVQENSTTETEKKSDKSSARGITSAKDSFEVSSSSNQENSGKKELGVAQQEEASKMNYKDFGNNGTTSQNSRPTYEDAKNSGLVDRLGHKKEENDSQSDRLPNGVTVADLKNLNSPNGSERTSDAVKDAQGKLAGGRNSREALEQEIAQRRQDFTMHGGSSAIDRALNSRPDVTADPKGKGSVPSGREQVEANAYFDSHPFYEHQERKNKDGSTTSVTNSVSNFPGEVFLEHEERTKKPDGSFTEETNITHIKDNTKVEENKKSSYDAKGQLIKSVVTTTTTSHGDTTVQTTTTTKNKDGSTTTVETPPTSTGGSKKMPGVDDRGAGNIPEDIKKSIEYDMQQIRNLKPKSGGETELTDGGVTGNSADGSVPVNDAFTRTGGVMGAVAQPTRAGEYVGGPSNGTVGSAIQNGGATDSLDGSSWTGTTHQDDPADVQFGPADQPKEQTSGKKNEDSDTDNSKSSILDAFRFQKRA